MEVRCNRIDDKNGESEVRVGHHFCRDHAREWFTASHTAEADLVKDPADTHWAHEFYSKVEVMFVDPRQVEEIWVQENDGEEVDNLRSEIDRLRSQIEQMHSQRRLDTEQIQEVKKDNVALRETAHAEARTCRDLEEERETRPLAQPCGTPKWLQI